MADIATFCEELGDFSNTPLSDLEIQELACVVHAAVSILIYEYISRIEWFTHAC